MIKDFEKKKKQLKLDVYDTEENCPESCSYSIENKEIDNKLLGKTKRKPLLSIGDTNHSFKRHKLNNKKDKCNLRSDADKIKKANKKQLKKIIQLYQMDYREIKFLVEWKDLTKEYVSNKIMNEYFPLDVIKFYEAFIRFEKNENV